jgi:hypothetical protein
VLIESRSLGIVTKNFDAMIVYKKTNRTMERMTLVKIQMTIPLRAIFSQAKAKGYYQARVNSDQVVIVIVRGRLDLVPGGQRRSSESWKTTLGSEET